MKAAPRRQALKNNPLPWGTRLAGRVPWLYLLVIPHAPQARWPPEDGPLIV